MRVGVVGVGLIGGSVAQALAQAGDALWLDDTSPSTQMALRQSRLGEVAPWEAWADQVDAVVVGVPLPVETDLVRKLVPRMRPQAQLLDLSSVKRPVQAVLQWASERVSVVSLHLMAGRETRGFHAASAELFRGCAGAVVDVGAGFPPEALLEWWQARLKTGPLSRWSVSDHDAAVAWVSHLPFLASYALRRLVEREQPGALALAGPGFRDTTRVGRSDVALMQPMLAANRAILRDALALFQEELLRASDALLRDEDSLLGEKG
ncbi:MAG: prephenate dehydrogenase/arogenate dehydrogenase family protein [Firmicutes bacterium]|nr:prephenate dehydrogenase/arogenate dehydrogenase family protein [Bacillota bacterium]